jgi:hypothetical protein
MRRVDRPPAASHDRGVPAPERRGRGVQWRRAADRTDAGATRAAAGATATAAATTTTTARASADAVGHAFRRVG